MAPKAKRAANDRNYKKLPAKELEVLLQNRNLVFGGTKLDMISRLIADDKKRDQETLAKVGPQANAIANNATPPSRPPRSEENISDTNTVAASAATAEGLTPMQRDALATANATMEGAGTAPAPGCSNSPRARAILRPRARGSRTRNTVVRDTAMQTTPARNGIETQTTARPLFSNPYVAGRDAQDQESWAQAVFQHEMAQDTSVRNASAQNITVQDYGKGESIVRPPAPVNVGALEAYLRAERSTTRAATAQNTTIQSPVKVAGSETQKPFEKKLFVKPTGGDMRSTSVDFQPHQLPGAPRIIEIKSGFKFDRLEALGLQISDIEFRVWSVHPDDEETMADMPPHPPDESGSTWVPKKTLFQLPLTPLIQEIYKKDSSESNSEEIGRACIQIWATVDCVHEDAKLKPTVVLCSSYVLVLLGGWGGTDPLRDFDHILGEHSKGRTVWTSELKFGSYGRDSRDPEQSLPDSQLWPGDWVHKWVAVNVMYSYDLRGSGPAAFEGQIRVKGTANIDKILSDRAKLDRDSVLFRNHYQPGCIEYFQSGDPEVFSLVTVEPTSRRTILTILYIFRVPRKIAEAAFIDVKEHFQFLRPYLGGWAETVKDGILLATSQDAVDLRREFELSSEILISTTENAAGKSSSIKDDHASSNLVNVYHELRFSLTRKEIAYLLSNRDLVNLKNFVNERLCDWREHTRHRKSREMLTGSVTVNPTSIVIMVGDKVPKERAKMVRKGLYDPHIWSPDFKESGGRAYRQCSGVLLGISDHYFPMIWLLKHFENHSPEKGNEITEALSHQPPPEDLDSACLDLIRDIYGMASTYLETLLAMEREFPARTQEMRKKANRFLASDFHVDLDRSLEFVGEKGELKHVNGETKSDERPGKPEDNTGM